MKKQATKAPEIPGDREQLAHRSTIDIPGISEPVGTEKMIEIIHEAMGTPIAKPAAKARPKAPPKIAPKGKKPTAKPKPRSKG